MWGSNPGPSDTKSKYWPLGHTPPRSKELRLEFSDPTNYAVPYSRIVINCNVWCRMATALETSKPAHGLTILPKMKEISDGCIFDMFTLSRTQLLVFFLEKTACFHFSTGNSSAQSILNLIPSSFHHGLSKCHVHVPGHITFVLWEFGCVRTRVRGFETQWECQKSGHPGAQPKVLWLNLRW